MDRADSVATQLIPDVLRRTDLLPAEKIVRLLALDGSLVEHEDASCDLDEAARLQLYRQMLITRRVDAEAISLARQGQMAVYTSSLGQEAAQVGSASALRSDDWIFPAYREHGVARVRGLDPAELLHHNRGTWISTHDPRVHRFAPQTVSIATQIVHAAGLATAARLAGDDIAAIAYFGDGATSEGDFHEGLNFAAVFDAPCVFFCQNNQWAISVPVDRQTRAPSIAHKAIGYGIPGVRVDGNDVLACFAVTAAALERARAGLGPTLIEAVTYRRAPHSGSDDPTRYEDPVVAEQWVDLDPLARFERHLRILGCWDDSLVAEWTAEGDQLAAAVREALYDAPAGDPLEAFDHVFSAQTGHLVAQRRQMESELRGSGS
ncbi:MAG: pyruvate dehydrogenase (acetyl-transferring) E1 component subunit alpha [Actinomycetota bacterium]|nr:pyruvate dehydrogenase (acetyl-transferring) E1 component subunit alpha [Actinomycetota bacterium]